jgi:uncharacterized membrane protein (UPF0136 family)
MTYSIVLLIYALIVLMGGLMGYLKGGSIVSLVAGGGSGALLLLLACFSFRESLFARRAAFVVIFLLDALFTYRFALTHHFFPSGLFSLMSFVTLIILAFAIKAKNRN